MTVRKSKRGGKRAGAGRPGPSEPRMQIAVSASSVMRLAAWARMHDVPTLRAAAETAIAFLTRDLDAEP